MGSTGLGAVFDDGSLVADAGLLLAGTVMSRLGLEALIDDTVRPGGSAGSGAGRKVLSLVASVLVGGCCIDDVQRPSGRARRRRCCRFGVVAPSTAGDVFEVVHVRACAPGSTRRPSWGLCGRGLWAPRRTWRR